MDKFVVDPNLPCYTFVGYAQGRFDADTPEGKVKKPYYNMYVISPVSSFVSEDYQAFGMKAEKKSCVSPDVWKDLQIGDKVRLLYAEKDKVALVVHDDSV